MAASEKDIKARLNGFASERARLAWHASMRPAWCDTVNDPIPESMKPQDRSVLLKVSTYHPFYEEAPCPQISAP
jgi:hypothetical protein